MANNVYARLVHKQKPISHPDLNIFVAKLLGSTADHLILMRFVSPFLWE